MIRGQMWANELGYSMEHLAPSNNRERTNPCLVTSLHAICQENNILRRPKAQFTFENFDVVV